MGASKRVVRWLGHSYPLRFDRSIVGKRGMPPLTSSAPKQLRVNYDDPVRELALSQMLLALKAKGCIRELAPGEEAFFSRVFLVPKRTRGHRLVIYLSTLNNYLSPVAFQMDTARRIRAVLPRVRGSHLSTFQMRFTTSRFVRQIRCTWHFR